jgi:hypothetical protein
MIDPGTGLTILGSAIGGAKIAEKILGPTSDYIGEQIKEWTTKKINNTANIFKNAQKKLGEDINNDGKVPPKVLKGILEDGAWCEEELQIEYFGGVLASSRSGISRDDRGAYFTSLISRLTTYQLRTHYLFYKCLKANFDGEIMNIGNNDVRNKLQMFIPMETYYKAMDFTNDEIPNIANLMTHSMFGLVKEDLIGQHFNYGGVEYLKKFFEEVPNQGIIFYPTALGVELMMWAYGYGKKPISHFFDINIKFENEQEIICGHSIPVKKQHL